MRTKNTALTIFLFVNFMVLSKFSFAQTFTTLDSGVYIGSIYGLYADSVTGLLHLGGNFDSVGAEITKTRGWCTWDGTKYQDKAGDFGEDRTRCIIGYGGHIYAGQSRVGAVFQDTQTLATRVLDVYDDGIVENGASSDDSTAEFCIYDGKLFVGGEFSQIQSGPDSGLVLNGITYYDGSHWHAVGRGVHSVPGDRKALVYGFAVWNNVLYVGGRFDTAGNVPAKNIAKWDGQTWSAVDDSGIRWSNGFQSRVRTLYVYQNKLLIGGSFDRAGNDTSVLNFATLDTNGVWGNMGQKFNGMVDRFQLYNGALYIGGHFQWPDTTVDNHLVVYKNGTWYKIADFNSHQRAITAFALWRGSIIIGGFYSTINETWKVANVIQFTTVDADITAAGSTTICEGESAVLNAVPNPDWSYQWMVDGFDIAGATNSSYSATQSGSYRVYVHNTEGDTSTTWTPVTVTVAVCTGIDSFSNFSNVQLYPNPAQNNLIVQYTAKSADKMNIKIYNPATQEVMNTKRIVVSGLNEFNFNISNLTSGIYILEMQNQSQTLRRKFIVSK